MLSADVREVLVIALGILLAFGVDASWTAWRERTELARHLSAVDAELAQNAEALAEIALRSREVLDATSALLAKSAPDAVAENPDSVQKLIGIVWNPLSANLSDGAMSTFLASGLLPELSDPQLREALASWPASRSAHRPVLDLAEERLQRVISPLLHRYVSEVDLNRVGGFSPMPELREPYGDLVAPSQFRSDFDGLLRDRQLESLLGQRAALALILSELAAEGAREASRIRQMVGNY